MILPIITLLSLYVMGGEVAHKGTCREYEYMRRRTKRFPWGEGNKSLYHNDETNFLPEECGPPNDDDCEEWWGKELDSAGKYKKELVYSYVLTYLQKDIANRLRRGENVDTWLLIQDTFTGNSNYFVSDRWLKILPWVKEINLPCLVSCERQRRLAIDMCQEQETASLRLRI